MKVLACFEIVCAGSTVMVGDRVFEVEVLDEATLESLRAQLLVSHDAEGACTCVFRSLTELASPARPSLEQRVEALETTFRDVVEGLLVKGLAGLRDACELAEQRINRTAKRKDAD